MADQRSRLTMDILARVRGTEDITRLGRAVDDVGDEMSEAARDAKLLEASIEDVTDELRELNRVALRGGDIDLDRRQTLRTTLSQLNRMRRELGDVERAGSQMGRTVSDALGALPSQLRGGLIVGLVGAAAAAAPFIGGVVSAAVIGGIGVGGIAGGIASAAQNPKVQAAAEKLVERIEQPFRQIGVAFVDPVIEALDTLGDLGTKVLGELRPEFRALAPVVADIAQGIAGMFEGALPGIRAALREAGPLLRALAQELPGLGQAIGEMLETISGGGADATNAMRTLFAIVNGGLVTIGQGIRLLTEAFGLFEDAANSPWTALFTGAAGIVVAEATRGRFAIKDLSDESGNFARVITDQMTGALGAGAQATGQLTEAQIATKDSMMDAALAAGSLHEALMILNGGALAVRAAENQFQAAIDAATESLETHGQTLNVNTEAGRSNRAALDTIATSAMDLASAIYEETGSQEAATDAIEQGRESLIDAARQMGRNEEDARQLADEILGIPRSWDTDFDSNANEQRQRIQRYLDSIRRIPTFKNTELRTTFTTFGTPPARGAGAFQHGGTVRGPGGIDRVLIRATAGEEVINRRQSMKHRTLLKAINSGAIDRGMVRAEDGSLVPASFYAKRANGAGRVRAEDGSMVPTSFYGRAASVAGRREPIEIVIRGDGTRRAAYLVAEMEEAIRTSPSLQKTIRRVTRT